LADTLPFSPGDIVQGLDPTELAEIRSITPFGANRVRVDGVTVTTHRAIQRPLTLEELARLHKVRGSEYTYDGDPNAFLHGAEAERIRIAHQFDPLFAVNSSVVDILPHQVEAVYRYLLPLPRIRFLLADETGAGKTIMTGLLIKELMFRGVLNKVLIITPGGLTKQWQQDEMSSKFGLRFSLVNRATFESDPLQFSRPDGFFITSIDYISRHDTCLNAARETRWDLIVVDEAHKLSAFDYGARVAESNRYRAVKELAPKTDHLLFLTATPHRGRKDTFRRLLLLLDPDLFQKDEHVTQRVQEAVAQQARVLEGIEDETRISQARNRFFLRRLKEEMVDWNAQPLFKPRHTQTVGYDLTPPELELYKAVTLYVRSRRKQAKEKRNKNVELTLMVMQRRLASSIYAITRTLENRVHALEEVLRILRDPQRAAEYQRAARQDANEIPQNIEEYEDLDDADREQVDKRIFRQVLSDKPADVEKERDEVQRLFEMATALRGHPEAKFGELLRVLDSSDVIRADDERLLIFTEHRDTLDNLAERLRGKGYSVVTIHGGMDVDARKQAQLEFKRHAKIMVATDAAGEGINLQFCRYMLNWDIPWNPNRLEQRMGRIHRYGQPNDVFVYNLVAVNTREGSVLDKVLRKMDVMRQQLGDDRVYDVIAEWLEDVPLVELIEQSIDQENDEALNRTEQALDNPARQQRADELVALQKKQSLASHLDLRAARQLRDESDEFRLQPLFIERFFERAYVAAGGALERDRMYPVFRVGTIPNALRELAHTARIDLAERYDAPFVFDKRLVSITSRERVPEGTQLLGPSHPLFEVVTEWTLRRAHDAFARGTILIDPNIAAPQRYWLTRSNIIDGRVDAKKRLAHQQMTLVVADAMGLRHTSSAYLLNCVAPDDIPNPDVSPTRLYAPTHAHADIQAWTFDNLTEPQFTLVQKERQAEVDLRREYLNTSFQDLILDLQDKLNDLNELELIGEDVGKKAQELEQRIAQLKARKTLRLEELEQMLRLDADMPEIVTSALAIPAPVAVVEADSPQRGAAMRRDDEVEQIAMDVVMRYERARGWTPHDVSKDGVHYDIRSQAAHTRGEDYIRYIEVKGRALTGDIVLTAPEVDKLRQLGERAFLYVVTYCKSNAPRLRIIQDPIPQLERENLFRAVQYLVDKENWEAKGMEITLSQSE